MEFPSVFNIYSMLYIPRLAIYQIHRVFLEKRFVVDKIKIHRVTSFRRVPVLNLTCTPRNVRIMVLMSLIGENMSPFVVSFCGIQKLVLFENSHSLTKLGNCKKLMMYIFDQPTFLIKSHQ